ncbi:MAG: aldehyde dehydrogenase family protein [Candidatus Nanopelagicales bacterium]|nr:aldehyde dehydrogenase family protein [Candidatus Nanopelagicales bacterium]MDZ4249515.1 aldehyde dehydrogenase family protein [Candidatus Nanopelagicales bacterium]
MDVSESTREFPVAGDWGSGGHSAQVRAPFDGSIIATVPQFGAADIDRAVEAGRAALRTNPLPRHRRAAILDLAAQNLEQRKESIARTLALEAAKPITQARGEVDRAASTLRFSAAGARTIGGEYVPLDASAAGEGHIGFVMRRPIGVVGAICPFNFPLNLVAHKVGPAIAAGCPVVVKPAGQTPLSALALASSLFDAGLPLEYLSVVPGPGSEVGSALVDHPDVALISFTGSPPVGWAIRQQAPRKRVGLELGNNSPLIICEDADVERAAAGVRLAGFGHAGQSCISTQRILVEESVKLRFIEALVNQVESLVVGDPLSEETEVSAMISTAERDRVAGWIQAAVENGASVATGGTMTPEGVLRPTVLIDARADDDVCANEIFGPVVVVRGYSQLAEAVAEANDTKYGLQAAIFTDKFDVAMMAVQELDFGGVLVNEVPTWRADQMPYGGLRDSGNTREGPAWAIHEMTEERLVVLRLP